MTFLITQLAVLLRPEPPLKLALALGRPVCVHHDSSTTKWQQHALATRLFLVSTASMTSSFRVWFSLGWAHPYHLVMSGMLLLNLNICATAAALAGAYAALLVFKNPYIYAVLTVVTILPQNSNVTSLNNLVLLFYESGLFNCNFAEAVTCVRLVTWLSMGFMVGSFALLSSEVGVAE